MDVGREPPTPSTWSSLSPWVDVAAAAAVCVASRVTDHVLQELSVKRMVMLPNARSRHPYLVGVLESGVCRGREHVL